MANGSTLVKPMIVIAWFGLIMAVGDPPPPELPAWLFEEPVAQATSTPIPTSGPGTPPPATPSPTPMPDPDLHFGSLRLAAKGTWMTFVLPMEPGQAIKTPELFVVRWYPGIGSDGLLDKDLGIAYQDREGRTVIWVHAGGGMAFTDVRNALEIGPDGPRESDTVGGVLGGMLWNPALVMEGGASQAATVTASIRLIPEEVPGLEQNWMDIPSYLSELYPHSYFSSVHPGDNYLMLVFCGRALSDPSVPYVPWFQQARFVIALSVRE